MSNPYRQVSPGEPLDGRHPLFSAARHNALSRLVNPAAAGMLPSPGPATVAGVATGPGGGAAGRRVVVYDEPAGYAFVRREATIDPVRCLPITRSGSTLTIDTSAAIIDAYPASDATFDFNADSCCGGDGVSTEFGLFFSTPINGNNRVLRFEPAEDAFSVSGFVNPTSTVDFEIQQFAPGSPSTVSKSQTQLGIVPDENGLWSTSPIDLSASPFYSEHLLLLTATERLANGLTTMPAAHMLVSYETRTGSEVDGTTNRPPAPELLTGLDGSPVTGGVTTDVAPWFRLTLPDDAITDPTGPTYELFVWDESSEIPTRYAGAATVFETVRTVQVQATSTLAVGRCRAQWVCYDTDGYYGGPSDPITFDVVSQFPTTNDPSGGERYGKIGYLVEDQDGTKTVFIGGCQHLLSQDEIDKLDGTVTATIDANGAFTTSDPTIAFDNFQVVSDPISINPTPPASPIAQPLPAVEGVDNAVIELRYEASAWRVVSVGGPA